MSLFGKYLAGWRFRSRTPAFESGDEFVAYVSSSEGDDSIVRVGDSELRLDQSVPADTQVRVRVTDFDGTAHEGTAEVLELLGTAEF